MVKSGDNINKEVALTGAVQSGDSPVAEPTKKSSGGRLLKVGRVVMGVVLVLALVAIGICAFTDLDDQLGDYLAYSKYNIKSESDAGKLIYEGKEKPAIWWYEGQIKQTKDKQKQAKLYLSLATLLSVFSNKKEMKLDKSLVYAKKAEDVLHSADTASILEEIYTKRHEQSEADKYNELYIQRSGGKDKEPIG
ncbi:MAG: hypothetical protein ACFNVL_03240 [Candidatus Nanoperiomorbus sp.]